MGNSSQTPRRDIANIPFIEALAARAARWPWWAIIIAGLIGLSFYSFTTSNTYRRALAFTTDDPRINTTDFASVIYDVRTANGSIERVEGILLEETDQTLVIRTQPQQTVRISRAEITTITCEPPECALGGRATLLRAYVSGRLLFENLGRYQIATEDGAILDILKVDTYNEAVTRQPPGCAPDREGSCRVTLPLRPEREANTIRGFILELDSTHITLETVPQVIRRLSKSDIASTIRYVPYQCALNNLSACDEGIFLTAYIAVVAFLLAVIIGLIAGLMRLSTNPILYNVATAYVEVLRGIPLVVTLLIVGFVVSPWLRDDFPQYVPFLQLLIAAAALLVAAIQGYEKRGYIRIDPAVFWQPIVVAGVMGTLLILGVGWFGANSELDLNARGILGLSLCYGAYLAELFRAGIQSIGRGQMEAARSLGMNYVQAMRYIILPQAFRVVLPPLGNEFIAMIKDTATLLVLGINEMTQRARIFAASTLLVFESYLTIGVLFLCMTLFLSFMVRTVERRLSTGH
ncbi:MAG: hypothetical protein OHK0023_03810 [Anaerolineae bacterium]